MHVLWYAALLLCSYAAIWHSCFVFFRIHLPDYSRTATRSNGWVPCNWTSAKVSLNSTLCFPSLTLFMYRLSRRALYVSPRFMVKHISDLLATPAPQGAPADEPTRDEDCCFDKLKEIFPLIVFSCVQLASKLFLHGHVGFATLFVEKCLQFDIIDWLVVPCFLDDWQQCRCALPAFDRCHRFQTDGPTVRADGLQRPRVQSKRSQPSDIRGNAPGGAW